MSLATKGYVNSVAGDGGGGGGGGDASWGNIKGNINNQLDLNSEFVRKSTFLNTIYPTGSIVMTYTKVSPSTYIGGEWELIEEGYYPVATVKDMIDEETERKISPILPKFTGSMSITGNGSSKAWIGGSGIIKVASTGSYYGLSPTGGKSSGLCSGVTIDSSIESNSIYNGDKDEVKPKSILVYFWRRVDNGTLTYNFVNISFSENDFITDPTTGQISLRNAVYYYTPGTIPKADETGKLVSSNINITDLVLKTRTIAGYDLENDITASEIQNAIKDINAILTNKNIDADNNDISNLEVYNFKTGIVRTSIRGLDQASNNNLATEKAIRDAIIEAVTGLFKIKGNKETISEIEALTGTEDYEAWTCSEDGHLYYWLNNKWNDFPLVNLDDLVKRTETPNSVYGNNNENEPLNYEVISNLSSNKFYRFDSTDEEQSGTYYTKILTDGENIDLYLIVIENEKVKSITISETKGTLTNGVLTVSEVIYSHIESEDGYYIVNADIKLLAVSTLKDILENSGGGKVDDVQVNGTSIVENKIANFEVPSQEEIEELFDDIDSPDAWEDDEPYTDAPLDTDTLSNVNLTTRKVKKISFANLFAWISNKLSSLFNSKADKSTTLSGYGITDAYNKTETDTKLNAKLNLSGGTMTGAIITKNGTGFKRDVDNDALELYGGTAYNKGAYIQLSGKDRSSIAGGFTLAATNGTTTKYFQGKPDGTLNWDGVSLMPVHYTGDSVMTISNIASQGLSNGADYASNVTRRIIKVGKMVYFTCHIKWASVAVGKAWTTVGTIASAFKPNFNRPIIVGMVYNNGLNEACGGSIDTSGVIQVWTNDKIAGNNYQIRLSGFWTVD